MPKSKKKKSHKKVEQTSTGHQLPSGFWPQVGAILLIAISILFVISWFGSGGPVLQWVYKSTLDVIGYSVYVVPFFATFLAIEIFKSKENRVSTPVKMASIFMLFWFSGLFGLFKNRAGQATGGSLGDSLNAGMLSLTTSGVAVFLYILLIFITLLFITQIQPFTVIKTIWRMLKRDDSEQESIHKIMEKVSSVDGGNKLFSPKTGPIVINESDVPLTGKSNNWKKSAAEKPEVDDNAAYVTARDTNWEAPSIELLDKRNNPPDKGDVQQNANIIRETLAQFGINVEMGPANVGSRVTQYTLSPESSVKLDRITQLETNLALNLAATNLRIEAPIPGQKLVGVEVPNIKAGDVRLYSIMNSKNWKSNSDSLAFAVGKDVHNREVIGSLDSGMPHIIIAGQTGSGKSVMVNALLLSLLYRNDPSQLKLILVDPKKVEMGMYAGIPHLLTPVITEVTKTVSALKWAVDEMERRFEVLAGHGVRSIDDYNQMVERNIRKGKVAEEDAVTENMPYIVIVIDELADLMHQAGKDAEGLIARITAKGRASGIHMVLATQRPSTDVITGTIKNNVPGRIAFTVPSQVDSRTIIDAVGAEKLLGMGDMLFKTPSALKPFRVQGAFVTVDEVEKVCAHLKLQAPPEYIDDIVNQKFSSGGRGGLVFDEDNGNDDPLFRDAVEIVKQARKASTSMLQTKMRIGYGRAARIISQMEEQGIISPADGSRPREVLIGPDDELEA